MSFNMYSTFYPSFFFLLSTPCIWREYLEMSTFDKLFSIVNTAGIDGNILT